MEGMHPDDIEKLTTHEHPYVRQQANRKVKKQKALDDMMSDFLNKNKDHPLLK